MDLTRLAQNSMDYSSPFRMMYGINVAKKALTSNIVTSKKMLEMLPDNKQMSQSTFRGHNTGDIPAIKKGRYLDVYV